MARRVAALIPFYEFDEKPLLPLRRRAGGHRRAPPRRLHARFPACSASGSPRPTALTAEAAGSISDLQFTARLPRAVPVQPRRAQASAVRVRSWRRRPGVTVTDLDGNVFYDLTGSYGVNLFGHDFYKDCIERGAERVRDLGPVLGIVSPGGRLQRARLRAISGLDEVSFHMSGTEAVMQAVRLARYHTGRSHLVRFCGAYHGWWGDVQPGIGNPIPGRRHLYAGGNVRAHAGRAAHAARHRLRAGQSAAGAASECRRARRIPSLVDSSRQAGFDRDAYTGWLKAAARGLRRAGHRADFRRGLRRLPPGARRRCGVFRRPAGSGDLRQDPRRRPCRSACFAAGADLMKRYRDDRPVDVCFARGTFNSASLRHGGDAGVPAAHRNAGNPRPVPGSGPRLERPRGAPQPPAARRRSFR